MRDCSIVQFGLSERNTNQATESSSDTNLADQLIHQLMSVFASIWLLLYSSCTNDKCHLLQ